MRILDENDIEVTNPDLELGYLKLDKVFVAHHDYIPPVKETYHYEVVKEYKSLFDNLSDNEKGGRELAKIIDSPAIEEKQPWDEYEDIQRYIKYTEAKPVPPESEVVTNEEIRLAVEKGVNSI